MERGGEGSRAHMMLQSSNVAGLTQMQSLSSVVVRPPSLGRSRRFPPHTPPSLPAAELREGRGGEGRGGEGRGGEGRGGEGRGGEGRGGEGRGGEGRGGEGRGGEGRGGREGGRGRGGRDPGALDQMCNFSSPQPHLGTWT